MAKDGTAAERRAARLATLTSLARPVQHEVNNLLTVVFANLELLRRTAAEGPPQRQLGRIQEAARRFETTTRAMLSLLRRPPEGLATLRLSEVVEALRPLLQLLLPAPGTLRLALEVEDAPITLDRAVFEETLLSLAAEVAEALPAGEGLGLELEALPEVTELRLTLPPELGALALQRLAALARAAGGEAAPMEGGWRLRLPVSAPG
ncbi:hypothetical protein JYK14_01100 [Siccirubricoccus sp. KC 17139]|uniref:histidine kinase n=1 Tax=Siccirubricoccus soli TaxID=2899147 RepID=A0ABT1CYN4_9PROT|nr:hypothetical protein [Siccirubricoccus soli]MCO6414778.1 hypothetical protein [Siccirubricoccus soli]MCP2680908.1 hypothetical protein [Siccirubricoccus soli]